MTDHLTIEPADPAAFALWALTYDPAVKTVSAGGFLVTPAMFAAAPDEVLDGAYIDGHIYRPVVAGLAPRGEGYAPDQVADAKPGNADDTEPEAAPVTEAPKPRRTRNRKAADE